MLLFRFIFFCFPDEKYDSKTLPYHRHVGGASHTSGRYSIPIQRCTGRYLRADKSPGLYDVALVARMVPPYSLHDLRQLSWVGYVRFISCRTSREGRLESTDDVL